MPGTSGRRALVLEGDCGLFHCLLNGGGAFIGKEINVELPQASLLFHRAGHESGEMCVNREGVL